MLTQWQIEPEFKYDVLCFIGILVGDPFYLSYYQAEYDEFAPLLTEEVQQALAHVKEVIKGSGNIVSATLCWIFSFADDSTLDALSHRLDHMDMIWERMENIRSESVGENRSLIAQTHADLHCIFQFLQDINFYHYWESRIQPQVFAHIREIEPKLPHYDIMPVVEAALGKSFAGQPVLINPLYYIKPHGMAMTGKRVLSGIAYPFDVVMRIAIHELMHPPCDFSGDSELKAAISYLRNDLFFMDKVENHNPDFGYNSFEGLVEEDIVQALDQVISEKFSVAENAADRWRESDDGMHVLAVALYAHLKHANFIVCGDNIRNVLIQILPTLDVKSAYDDFYASA